MYINHDYVDILKEELERRKIVNSSYSLRAFARDLDISPPRLSQVLNKKQGISVEAANEIANKLKFDDKKKILFCDLVGSLHSRSNKEKEAFKEKLETYKAQSKKYYELNLEFFNIISKWYHFAILELTYLKDFDSSPQWISFKLQISLDSAEDAISRLLKLNLLRVEEGILKDNYLFVETTNDIPSDALKTFHTALIKKALDSLFEKDVFEREISSNIIAINKNDIHHFKDYIRNFRRELDSVSTIQAKDAVYCLAIQFFELTGSTQ